MLLLAGRHRGYHRFNKARALGTVGSKTALAPKDPGAERPLGRIVRRLHLLVAYESQGPATPSRSPDTPRCSWARRWNLGIIGRSLTGSIDAKSTQDLTPH
jgi:hypothetical protein